jgi:RNase H-like domain found in reverse transcriptase
MQLKCNLQVDYRMSRRFCKDKAEMSCQVTLAYPDYTKPFYIHTDASQFQLGGVISQYDPLEDFPVSFAIISKYQLEDR